MPTVQIVRFRPGPFDWHPPTLWRCPICRTSLLAREPAVRCPTCGHLDESD